MKQLFLAITIFFLMGETVKSQSCKGLPEKFESYIQAISTIENSTFKLTDKIPYQKSSWIVSANYYSCNGKYGYLVYTTDKSKVYIHEKVPLKVWTEFKNAGSSNSYYVNNIQGAYRLVPE